MGVDYIFGFWENRKIRICIILIFCSLLLVTIGFYVKRIYEKRYRSRRRRKLPMTFHQYTDSGEGLLENKRNDTLVRSQKTCSISISESENLQDGGEKVARKRGWLT